jgi:hypothetical protein
MSVDEKNVDFYFKHRNESDFKRFNNRAKTIILHDDKLINRRLDVFNFLENVSDNELVDNRRSNHRCINLFDSCEDCVLSRDWNLRKSHELTDHLFLNFSNVWFSSELNVDLQFQHSNVDFRSDRDEVNVNRDCHIESFWIAC